MIPTRLKPCPRLAVDPDPATAIDIDIVWHHYRNSVSGSTFITREMGVPGKLGHRIHAPALPLGCRFAEKGSNEKIYVPECTSCTRDDFKQLRWIRKHK